MTPALPIGLQLLFELEIVADDPVWMAVLRRAVLQMASPLRPRIQVRGLDEPLARNCAALLIELPAEPQRALRRLAGLRRHSPNRLIIGLWSRNIPLEDLGISPVELHHWLTSAGASAVVYSPRETYRLSEILDRVTREMTNQQAPAVGAPLPAGWQ